MVVFHKAYLHWKGEIGNAGCKSGSNDVPIDVGEITVTQTGSKILPDGQIVGTPQLFATGVKGDSKAEQGGLLLPHISKEDMFEPGPIDEISNSR